MFQVAIDNYKAFFNSFSGEKSDVRTTESSDLVST